MRLFEIIDTKNLQQLANACNSWIALEHTSKDIKYILSHPFSQKFKTIHVNEIYRAVFYSYKKFLKTKVAKVKPQPEGFVAYSIRDNWGDTARSDFDYDGDILLFKKQVNGGVILNFTELLKSLNQQGCDVENVDEGEIWMQATPHYTTFNKSELIDKDLSEPSVNIGDSEDMYDKNYIQRILYNVEHKGYSLEQSAQAERIPADRVQIVLDKIRKTGNIK